VNWAKTGKRCEAAGKNDVGNKVFQICLLQKVDCFLASLQVCGQVIGRGPASPKEGPWNVSAALDGSIDSFCGFSTLPSNGVRTAMLTLWLYGNFKWDASRKLWLRMCYQLVEWLCSSPIMNWNRQWLPNLSKGKSISPKRGLRQVGPLHSKWHCSIMEIQIISFISCKLVFS